MTTVNQTHDTRINLNTKSFTDEQRREALMFRIDDTLLSLEAMQVSGQLDMRTVDSSVILLQTFKHRIEK